MIENSNKHNTDINNLNVTIIGLGKSGEGAANLAHFLGASILRSFFIFSALEVVCSTGTFPDTEVIPTISVHLQAVIIAIASSTPGSQSRIIFGLEPVVIRLILWFISRLSRLQNV